MSDPQNLGLGELGQRVQALSDPVAEPHLRPYRGAPLPVGPSSNGRPIPSYESYEEFRVTPVTSANAAPEGNGSQRAHPSPYAKPASVSANWATSASIPVSPAPGSHASPAADAPSAWEDLAAASRTAAPPAAAAPPPVTPAADDPNGPKSGLQRAVNAVRAALPLVQKLLPLLDGNFASAIGALVAPQPVHHPPTPPQPPVDLDPLERGLAEVKNSHRELRTQVQEQVTTLKRVEDQLERVREATDRNTLEQQELVEDLRSMGHRIITFVIVGIVLLAGSIGLNIFFLVQLQHILR